MKTIINKCYAIAVLLLIGSTTFAQSVNSLNAYEKTKLLFSKQKDPAVFTVLSYNVYEGFRKDSSYINAFRKWVAERSPDVVAFQELNGFSKDQLVAMAKGAGYPYTVLQKRKGFPLALMSKHPVSHVKKIIEGMHHGMLYAKILDYHFFITHLNPKVYGHRITEVDTLLKHIAMVPKNEKILLMGDFNNMSPLDKNDYDNPDKMKLLVNSEKNNPEMKILHNGKIDFTAIQHLLDSQLYDSWKLFNTVYEKSAPTKIRKHNNYTRIDHIYVNEAAKADCIDATIVKDDLTDTLSDHYPMLLILKNSK